ncbi:MAG: TraR/DksA family transcriptional regulator [Pseudomonadota bacterium]
MIELDENTVASEDSRKPVELDQSSIGRLSRMDAMQQQAMALAAERRRQTERRKLVAAIERIDDDEFGDCVRCGDEISRGRLEFDAAITLCGACMKGDAKT